MQIYKYLTALLLITTLITPSLAIAQSDADSDSSGYSGASDSADSPSESGPGPGMGSGESGYAGGSTGDSPSEGGPGPGAGGADAEATNQAAADAETAAGYGMTGDVDVNGTADARMSGTIDNDQVAMSDGTVQSLSAGAAAADAISAAAEVGGYVDTTATHASYQNDPDMTPGTVVGALTGTIGYPAAVAKAEINAAVAKASVEDAAVGAINKSAAAAYAATAKNIAQAYQQAAQSMQQAGVLGLSGKTVANTSVTTPGTVASYQAGWAQSSYSGPKGVTTPGSGLNQAAQNAYNNIGQYSYDLNSSTNGVVGGWTDQNGRAPSAELSKSLDSISSEVAGHIANANNDLAVSYDMKTDQVSVTNLNTGTKVSASLSSITGNTTQTQNADDTPVGQMFGKTYSGPKGVSVTQANKDFVTSVLGPNTGLNAAAQYAGRISAGQQPAAVPSDDPDEDSKITAGLAMAEDPQAVLAMESIVNRALARNISIRSVAASTEYQPVLDQALKNCGGCTVRSLTQDQLNQALDQVVAASAKRPGFAGNVTMAKSMIAGTHVMTGLDNMQGYVDFTNVSLAISQGRASKDTISEVTAMRDDPNSTTLREGKFNEQTFGIRAGSKAPDYTPQSISFNAYKDISSSVTTGTKTNSDTNPDTTPDTTDNKPNNNDNTNTRNRNIGATIGGTVAGPIGSIVGGFLGGLLGNSTGNNNGGKNKNTNTSEQRDQMRLCPPYPISCQSGAAILALPSLPSFSSWFEWLDGDEVAEPEILAEKKTVPVLITVNYQTGEIEINRPDINATLENPTLYYTDEQLSSLNMLFNETPVLLNGDGDVIYSNGLYSPPVKYSEAVGQDVPEYVYTIEYVDESGALIEIGDNDNALPDNLASNLVRSFVGNATPFEAADIASVTYRVVEPDADVLADEYYDYVITLNDGSVKAVTIPEFTSTAHMQKRFEQLGFKGKATEILGMATETFEEPEQGLLSQLFSLVSDTVAKFTDSEPTGDSVTALPTLDNNLTTTDIETIYIYPFTDISCPTDVEGYERGFMYTAIIKNKMSPDYVTMVSDGRCGYGSPDQLVTEVAHHLESTYGIEGTTYASIVDKTSFKYELTAFEQIVTNVYRPSAVIEPVVQTPTEEPITEPATTTPEQKPNLTNDVKFETKAIGSNGKVLLDWSEVKSVNMSADVSLYFRWDGSAYQQCLPFLQDAGNYALTRKDKAMLKGDTESEGFNVPEKTASYRVECGGQRNNEFGVDERVVEVTIE